MMSHTALQRGILPVEDVEELTQWLKNVGEISS